MNDNNHKYWHTNSGFRNPKGSTAIRGFSRNSVRWIFSRIIKKPYMLGIDLPANHILPRDAALSLLDKYKDTPSLTWLGHATFLMSIGRLNILTDPFLIGNVAYPWIRALKRLPCPLSFEDLPSIDILLVSHEHRDHLHHPSLKRLKNKSTIQPIIPLGLGKRLKRYNFKDSIELDWFDSYELASGKVTVSAVPAAHYSSVFGKKNETLWAGFIISFYDRDKVERKIYFAGDTDYGSFIKRDITPYGPFDVACIGVGGFYLPYKSRADFVHTNPEEAVETAKDINAKHLVGMHWGTARMADENPNELLPRMQAHTRKINYTGDISMLRIGETIPIY